MNSTAPLMGESQEQFLLRSIFEARGKLLLLRSGADPETASAEQITYFSFCAKQEEDAVNSSAAAPPAHPP